MSRSRYKARAKSSVRNNSISARKSNSDYTGLSSISARRRTSVEYHTFLVDAAKNDAPNDKAKKSRTQPVEHRPFLIEGARNRTPHNNFDESQTGLPADKYRIERAHNRQHDHFSSHLPNDGRSPRGNPVVELAGTPAEKELEATTRTWPELPTNETVASQSSRSIPTELENTQIKPSTSSLRLTISDIPALHFELTGDSPHSLIPEVILPQAPSQTPVTTTAPLPTQTVWSHLEQQDGVPTGYVATLRHRELLEFKVETVAPRRHWPKQSIKEVVVTEAEDADPPSPTSVIYDPDLLTVPKKAYNVKQRRRQSIEGSIRSLRIRGRRLSEADIEPREAGRRLSALCEYDRWLSAEYVTYR